METIPAPTQGWNNRVACFARLGGIAAYPTFEGNIYFLPTRAQATITGFSPTGGVVGTSVTISGTGFAGATSVTFNGVRAAYSVKGMHIMATVPAGVTTGPIAVTTPEGVATSATDFTVVTPPTITGLTPTSGPEGSSVTIAGANFLGTTAVKFSNNRSAAFTVDPTGTEITATVPNKARTGPISVTAPAGTASTSSFTVTP